MRPAIPDTIRNGPEAPLPLGTARESFDRYESGMLDKLESRVPPMGHHATDKDTATRMRINNVMMNTLSANPFLPNLLVLSVPSQSAQLKPGMIYPVHCTQYTLSLTHLGSPLDTSKPTTRATPLLNPWCSGPFTRDGKIVQEEEVIVGVYDEKGNRAAIEGISRNITGLRPVAGGSSIPLH